MLQYTDSNDTGGIPEGTDREVTLDAKTAVTSMRSHLTDFLRGRQELESLNRDPIRVQGFPLDQGVNFS
jgi:hypothetical protein